MNEGIELGLKGCGPTQVKFDEFDRRDFFGANARGDLGDGGERRKGSHKRKCESIHAWDAGQARTDVRDECEVG